MINRSDTSSRYSRQVKLPQFGLDTQHKLQNSRILVVGIGGLGCPASQYLAGMGVGKLTLVDFDIISEVNLHRQLLFSPADIGKLKAEVAKEKLSLQNPDILIKSISDRLNSKNIIKLIKQHDIILDCTDNFETRLLLNDACVLAEKPLVYGAAYQYQGQVAVWNIQNSDNSRSPNYRDVFGDTIFNDSSDCASGGVLPTLTGIIGTLQANEAIKLIAGLNSDTTNKLLIYDALTSEIQVIRLPKTTESQISHLPDNIPTILGDDPRLKNFTLIDVRSPAQHKQFNIGGTNIPLETILLDTSVIKTDNPIVFYCQTGKKSMTAGNLVRLKYSKAEVYSLSGGVEAYQK